MEIFNIEQELPVTIGVINFNGEHLLIDTLKSIENLSYSNFSTIMVDNGSSDNSVRLVKERFPNVFIIAHGKNLGPNAARNTVVKNSKTCLVFIIDNDIILSPESLRFLVNERQKREDIIVCTPRILYEDGEKIQSDGVRLHYLCNAIHYNRNIPIEQTKNNNDAMVVECGSGGMMLIDKKKAEPLRFFDEDFFFAWDDTEFTYRITSAGYKCLNVPQAFVYHKAKTWGTKRAFYQIRNRWYFILIYYSFKTIILILPMLLCYEILLFLLMLLKKDIKTYFKSWKDIIFNIEKLRIKRRFHKSIKKLSDKELLHTGNITIDKGLIRNPILLTFKRLLNFSFDLYWITIRAFL